MSEAEQIASLERAHRAIAAADETLARLAERTAQREADGTALAERIEARQQQQREREAATAPKPVPAITRAPARQAAMMDDQTQAAWDRWCNGRVGALLKLYDKAVLDDVHEAFKEAREISRTELKTAIDGLRTEIARSEERVRASLSSEIKIAALEARLEAAERRSAPTPSRPRLVDGGSDAA